jgi:Tfp pilus assembly protein PilO
MIKMMISRIMMIVIVMMIVLMMHYLHHIMGELAAQATGVIFDE